MNGTVGFFQELLGASSQDEGGGLGSSALCKHVVSLGAHLDFLELPTGAQDGFIDIVHSRLNSCSRGLLNALDVVVGNTASTEHPAVGEVLRSQVSDGQAR